tara:strand:- start:287 stop:580 length:294 start_codon:yes stop_codon:yes gene_type:complete
MKKLKLSVAALLIASSGFSTNPPTNEELTKEISMTVEDIIQSMRIYDSYEIPINKMYIHNLLDVLSKLEDLQTNWCKDFECPNYREQIYRQTEVERR